MSTITNSEYLEYIIGQAKKLGARRNPPFTAERFLVALLDDMNEEESTFQGAERVISGNLMRRLIKDIEGSRQVLMEHINDPKEDFLMADLYMKKKLREATELTQSTDSKELDVPRLLILIRRDPTEVIRSVISVPKDEEESENSTPVAEPKPAEQPQEEEDDSAVAFWDVFGDDDEEEAAPVTMGTLVADVKRIRETLRERVYGQDNAIDVFSNGYFQANLLHMIDRKRQKPKATFLFAGPPGVGKTFLAEEVAAALDLPFRRFDMSEYADKV